MEVVSGLQLCMGGKLQPTELYNLANDPKESTNLLNQDDVKPVLEYLLKVAEEAAEMTVPHANKLIP